MQVAWPSQREKISKDLGHFSSSSISCKKTSSDSFCWWDPNTIQTLFHVVPSRPHQGPTKTTAPWAKIRIPLAGSS